MVGTALPVLNSIADEFLDAAEALPRWARNFAAQFLPIDSIRPNPNQPRREFDEEGINSLADSLHQYGVLQPILVRPADDGYEIVAGERRFRAAIRAGMSHIAAVVRDIADDRLLELSLVENSQRKNLNPVERARSYARLNEKNRLSHEAIGKRVGEDRKTVGNFIRLLDLCPVALDLLKSGQLDVGQGKALLGVSDANVQAEMARNAAQGHWPVRRVEAAVRSHRQGKAVRKPSPVPKAASAVQELLESKLRVKVAVRTSRRPNRGWIRIDFRSLPELERIAAEFGCPLESLK